MGRKRSRVADVPREISRAPGDFPRAGTGPPREGLIDCREAAELLDVPPTALFSWSRTLEFPCEVGDPAAPHFRREEIEALRATLPNAHSIAGAICAARRRVG